MILSPTELEELERELEALSEMCAEDASEAAAYGDGPCGSYERALAYGAAQARLRAHNAAVQTRYLEDDTRHGLDDCAEIEDSIPF